MIVGTREREIGRRVAEWDIQDLLAEQIRYSQNPSRDISGHLELDRGESERCVRAKTSK